MIGFTAILGQSLTVFSILTGLGVGIMVALDMWSRPR